MAPPPEPQAAADDIEARYAIDLSRPLPDAGGGQAAFAATDRLGTQGALMALRVGRGAPPRANALQALREPIENLLTPVASLRGPVERGERTFFVICHAPPGPPILSQPRAWSEAALLAQVLRPIAQILVALDTRGLTHRAIRADNVFDAGPNRPVVLGSGWATPPAMLQPAAFEPTYSAVCHPAGRGPGQVADDVYALGVLLLALALGREPLAGMDPIAVITMKLAQGSFNALIGDARLPPLIADLVRNMLAEDPDHRPPPMLLLDPMAAGGRRVAARPPRKAQRPLPVGGTLVWDSRTLAYAIGMEPAAGLAAMRCGDAMQWLRRGLGDAGLAVRLEELERHRASDGPADDARADAAMVMRAVALIDPLAPLFWRGVALWPEGLGPMLAAGHADAAPLLDGMAEIIANEVVQSWGMLRPDRCDFTGLRIEGRRHRDRLMIKGPSGGLSRLLYTLNPLLPCASPLVASAWAYRLQDLPPALEATAQGVDTTREPIDPHLVAFIAARSDRMLDSEVNGLNGRLDDAERAVAQLRLVAVLQARYWPVPLPALAAWIAARAGPLVTLWHNRPKREAVAATLNTLAAAGFLTPMLALVEDPPARASDLAGAVDARARLILIDAELAEIASGAPRRSAHAARVGQEIAAAAGLTALAVMLVATAIG